MKYPVIQIFSVEKLDSVSPFDFSVLSFGLSMIVT